MYLLHYLTCFKFSGQEWRDRSGLKSTCSLVCDQSQPVLLPGPMWARPQSTVNPVLEGSKESSVVGTCLSTHIHPVYTHTHTR